MALAIAASALAMPATAFAAEVNSIRVLDYYNDSPDREIYGELLNACGAELGITINREVVPGSALMSKVLQQGASRTLPDLLMLDNPELQQIASTGALVPLGQNSALPARASSLRSLPRRPMSANSMACSPSPTPSRCSTMSIC